MSYAYQWQRCNSSGASCAAISGATATSYVLASADVGSTIRVGVSANNSAGSGSATSAASAVITALTTSWSGAYYAEYLDDPFNILSAPSNNPFWVESNQTGSESWISDGAINGAIRLTSNAVNQAGSTYGQQQSVVVGSRPTYDPVHGGRVPGSGTGCCDGKGQPEDTWYRWKMRFPIGYQPTQGSQNYGFEFHIDDKTAADAQKLGNAIGSTVVDVMSDYPVTCTGSPYFCTTPGTNPRLFLQVSGGKTSDSASTTIKRYFPFASNSLILGHWYDMVLHIDWSPDPSVGHVQWWVDGVKVVDAYTATEYVRSDGTYSYAEDLAMENYRLWANWSASIDYDEIIWGSTAAAVGFSP